MRLLCQLPAAIAALTMALQTSAAATLATEFSYAIDRFSQVGGTSGSASFVDEFDDGLEPPSGPRGASTYFVLCPLHPDSEVSGFLYLDERSVCIDEEGSGIIDVTLTDYSGVEIMPGVGGSIEGKFRFADGVTPNTAFGIEMGPTSGSIIRGWISVAIWKTPSGNTFASVRPEGTEEGVIPSDTDVSSFLADITDITLRISSSPQNVLTGSLDFESDGTFEMMLPGSGILYAASRGNILVERTVPEPDATVLGAVALLAICGVVTRKAKLRGRARRFR